MCSILKFVFIATAIFISTAKAGENEHGKLPHHHLAAFVGVGFEEDKNGHYENDTAIGVKYELQFHEKWGVGLDVEKLYGDDTDRAWVVAIPLRFYLDENWKLFLGPGYELKGDHDKYLTRTGVAYEFDLKDGWSLSPEIVIDFISGGATTYVAGVAIGHSF